MLIKTFTQFETLHELLHEPDVREWINAKLGVTSEQWVVTDEAFADYVAPYIAGVGEMPHLITKVEEFPAIQFISSRFDRYEYTGADSKCLFVAVWAEGCQYPAIICERQMVVGHSSGFTHADFCITRRDEHKEVMTCLYRSKYSPRKSNRINCVNGRDYTLPKDGYRWDRVIMSDASLRLIRDDFENFLRPESKQWFQERDIPYKRGYLFYGEPGNGKTSVIRVMSCHPKIRSVYTIDFANPETTNGELSNMFVAAANNEPSLVFFEDIDRVFGELEQGESHDKVKRKITLQHFLNCLDGLQDRTGTVIVATANDPTLLDPAIMNRPGRFDRVVKFQNPTLEQRQYYFSSRFGVDPNSDFGACAQKSEGMSFAQIQEAFTLAAQSTFTANQQLVTSNMIIEAIDTIKNILSGIGRYNFKRGGFSRTSAGFGGIVRQMDVAARSKT